MGLLPLNDKKCFFLALGGTRTLGQDEVNRHKACLRCTHMDKCHGLERTHVTFLPSPRGTGPPLEESNVVPCTPEYFSVSSVHFPTIKNPR